ncbi:uncharacterized protein LOC111069406 [Drosophila obscura]|uniref:uncharacterized protein LOC111069406 n=1 Tax=Drosophila obscura TaxID=7282 RepID=UPI001BB15AC2|nr:uncharacterized protein LOC111069406 [Drosophila obscura]
MAGRIVPWPKYLTVTRLNSSEGLQNVSIELIRSVFEYMSFGPIEFCRKLNNGTVLVKTWGSLGQQVSLLSLNSRTDVEVQEHWNLNHGRAVMHSYELAQCSEAEIVQQLQQQNVIQVRKITRRKKHNQRHETGLIVLQFGQPDPPSSIQMGCKVIRLHPYVPHPRRCWNCLYFGHHARQCHRPRTCANCGYAYHLNVGERCNRTQACLNCRASKVPHPRHHIFDRKCPTFVLEDRIKAISVLSGVSRRRAISIYKSQSHRDMTYFAEGARLSYLKCPQGLRVRL